MNSDNQLLAEAYEQVGQKPSAANEKSSALRTFVEDEKVWEQPLEVIKQQAVEHISKSFKNPVDVRRMSLEISRINNLVKLQQYIFNSLLKFEGQGVVGPIPR